MAVGNHVWMGLDRSGDGDMLDSMSLQKKRAVVTRVPGIGGLSRIPAVECRPVLKWPQATYPVLKNHVGDNKNATGIILLG